MQTSQPAGKVVFLFTDIEGSTRLWEEHPEEMKQALAQHDSLLRGEIESRNGYVFKTVGDAFCAAFSSPVGALSAGLASQLSIRKQRWPNIGGIRIRVALHAGFAELRDGDYFGSDVNRVARLLSITRGGSVLLSGAVADLAKGSLPDGISLRDLGEHFLRDVAEPLRIFQILHPELPDDFPLVRTSDRSLHNLPAQLSPFVGRDQDLAEVKKLLSKSRMVTLSGSGGCGKTRLSLEAAGHLVSAFQEGVWFVELASLTDPAFVPQELANSLGLMDDSGGSLLSNLITFLKGKQVLILLDNCEHVIDACARLAESLLKVAPDLHFLATSRQPLGVQGEVVYRVPSLSTPDVDIPLDVSDAGRYDSIRLFVERAKVSQPGFVLTPQNVAPVSEICRRLDGIPLAVELAASRAKVLSPHQIAERLKNSFKLLAGGSRTALPRHQTLLATMEWSHSHLMEQEKILFRRLAVFSGGFDLKMAEKVCSGGGIDLFEALDLLTLLVDKSLVQVEDSGGETRYRLLAPVREYALEKLRESGEEKIARDGHRDYFAALAEEAEPELTGMNMTVWLKKLQIEHDNLRAALTWCESSPEGAGISLQLSGALWKFWYAGYLSEARRWLDRALKRDSEAIPAPVRGRAYLGAGTIAWRQNDREHVVLYCRKSHELFKASGIKVGMAYSLNSLASVSNFCGDYAEARELFLQSHSLFKEIEDPFGSALAAIELALVSLWLGEYDGSAASVQEGLDAARAIPHMWLEGFGLAIRGHLSRSIGKPEEARSFLEESLSRRKLSHDKPGISESLALIGWTWLDFGDTAHAGESLQEALTVAQEIGWPWMTAFSLDLLGKLALAENEPDEGLDLHRQALMIRRNIGDRRGIAESLEGCAACFLARGEFQESTEFFAVAEAVRAELHAPVHPADLTARERALALLREKLGEQAFQQAWKKGAAMDRAQCVSRALAEQEAAV